MIYENVFNFKPFEYEATRRTWNQKDHEVYISEVPKKRGGSYMVVRMSSDLLRESGIKEKSVSIYQDHEVFMIAPDKDGELTVKSDGRFGGSYLARALIEATGKTAFKGEVTAYGGVIFR